MDYQKHTHTRGYAQTCIHTLAQKRSDFDQTYQEYISTRGTKRNEIYLYFMQWFRNCYFLAFSKNFKLSVLLTVLFVLNC